MGEDATFGGGSWTLPNAFNPGVGDIVSSGLTESDRVTIIP
jgi:hypothetical protein